MKSIEKGTIKLVAFVLLFAFFFFIIAPMITTAKTSPDKNMAAAQSAASNPPNAEAKDYKKPEFYPTYGHYKEKLKDAPKDRIGIWGIGIYPARQNYESRQNSEINVTAYVHTSWFVQTYQGLMLEAEYDKRYFDVKITPDTLLLGPSYPDFHEEWAQKITVKIKVMSAPKGIHYININPSAAPAEISQQWQKAHKPYVSGMPAAPEQAYLRIAVNVR